MSPRPHPHADTLAAAREEYQEATAAYTRWARIEDRLSDDERRQKEAASKRVDRAWRVLERVRR